MAWVERLLVDLASQARPISGGWPGTVSEARLLVATQLSTGKQAPTGDGVSAEALARWVYKLAKRAWLARAGTTPEI